MMNISTPTTSGVPSKTFPFSSSRKLLPSLQDPFWRDFSVSPSSLSLPTLWGDEPSSARKLRGGLGMTLFQTPVSAFDRYVLTRTPKGNQ